MQRTSTKNKGKGEMPSIVGTAGKCNVLLTISILICVPYVLYFSINWKVSMNEVKNKIGINKSDIKYFPSMVEMNITTNIKTNEMGSNATSYNNSIFSDLWNGKQISSNSIFSDFCEYPITLYNETLRKLICNTPNISKMDLKAQIELFKDIYPIKMHRKRIDLAQYLVFIHLDKTAGESVEATLGLRKSHKKANDRIKEVLEYNKISFTTIRNPYSRTFSWFKFCNHGWGKYYQVPIAPFSENRNCTACYYAQKVWKYKYQNNTKQYTIENAKIAFELWLKQTFIHQTNMHCMETNLPFNLYLTDYKTNKFMLDLIIKFENIKSDWNIFLNILGLDQSKYKLGHKNTDDDTGIYMNKLLEKHWRYYYTEITKKIVRDRFRVDFELFNYDIDFKLHQ